MFTAAALPYPAFVDDPSALRPMTEKQLGFFRELAMAAAGISLAPYKRNMVHRRLSKRLHALGIAGFGDYIALLQSPGGRAETEFFVNALTTNKTEFFRENHHFQHLGSQVLPDLGAARRLRLWSAGCASGQEAYSMAMTLLDTVANPAARDIRILATDIDTEMIAACRRGVYRAADTLSIGSGQRRRYLEPTPGSPDTCRMAPALRQLVTFNPLNLNGAWPMQGKFDVVFCRNVIIYFDKPTQITLFDRFASQMHDGGYLYIGHSESLYKVTERFRPIGQSIYRKVA